MAGSWIWSLVQYQGGCILQLSIHTTIETPKSRLMPYSPPARSRHHSASTITPVAVLRTAISSVSVSLLLQTGLSGRTLTGQYSRLYKRLACTKYQPIHPQLQFLAPTGLGYAGQVPHPASTRRPGSLQSTASIQTRLVTVVQMQRHCLRRAERRRNATRLASRG
ncbi:hypothetical protein M011DRAFT_242741 [Sporormia fimetaria CBS 119925]|uniref:Uncharacterized protein n=1 Tax=Sporormia fimetaria CBS 119925 TaxID=1340428 RepID=A0A6A6VII0_9PLEO|nr:hypothetical protein M011DRAFT_242741 [Sporormia fimetaria CBS 119925]